MYFISLYLLETISFYVCILRNDELIRNSQNLIFQEYQLSGADIVEDPIDKPWGMREMLVKDIDGNTFRIGCSLNEKC